MNAPLFEIVTQTHDSGCGWCREAAYDAASHARVNGSTGASYTVHSRNTHHSAETGYMAHSAQIRRIYGEIITFGEDRGMSTVEPMWEVTSSTHDALICPACQEAAQSAAAHARVTGSTGGTYSVYENFRDEPAEEADEHRVTVRRIYGHTFTLKEAAV